MNKPILLLLLAFLAIGGASAQVRVQVGGDAAQTLDTTGGIYFAGDTMHVVSATGDTITYNLDDVSIITFQVSEPDPEGIATAEVSNLTVAPVPARDVISVQGIGSTPQTLTIYSTAGVKLHQQTATDDTHIDISHLPEGVYVLRCGDKVSRIIKN